MVRVGGEPDLTHTCTHTHTDPSRPSSLVQPWCADPGRPAEQLSAETEACCLFDESLNSPFHCRTDSSVEGSTKPQGEWRVDKIMEAAVEKDIWTSIWLCKRVKNGSGVGQVQCITCSSASFRGKWCNWDAKRKQLTVNCSVSQTSACIQITSQTLSKPSHKCSN